MMINQIINILYRYPKGYLLEMMRKGGPIEIYEIKKGKREMEIAANKLNFIVSENAKTIHVPINFISGKNHWYLTSFCIYSLIKSAPSYKFTFRIFDDGTIDESIAAKFYRIPNLEIIYINQIEKKLDEVLPRKKYPNIRSLRDKFFMMKKLTDVHTYHNGFNFYLDSDILFLNKPQEIIDWAILPTGSFTIQDCTQSYGIDFELMKKVTGNDNIPSKLNAGVYGIKSSLIDFDLIEKWIVETANPKGFGNYYWEQAFTAMLVSYDTFIIAPNEKYIVMPSTNDVKFKKGVLHHYVDKSQSVYFKYAWKNVL
jgi:hypothetical protein